MPTKLVRSSVSVRNFYATKYDLLRSFESRYHLPFLGHAADTTSKSLPSVVSG